jgi:hypothetical protein
MVATPILGSSYVTRSPNAADNRMINLFPEVIPEGGKTAAWLQRAPGLRLLTRVGSGPIRGLWTFADPNTAVSYGYVVSGTKLYKLATDYTFTELGTVVGTGQVNMVDNGTQLYIAAGAKGYIYNANTNVFAEITDVDFYGAVGVGFLDGYFVYNEPNSQNIWVSSLNDGTAVDPTDYASIDGSPDNLVTLLVDHREVWCFGSNSIEVWYNAGLPTFPLARIQGAFNEIGCLAAYSVAKLDNGIFWLGADARGNGIVYRSKGYSGERVSTHAVEWQIQQYTNLSDAVGYTYQQDGHSFYVLNFPTADTTWVYDVATQVWHERAGWENDAFTRTRGNCQMNFNNTIVIGDYRVGELYAYDPNVYSEAGTIQKWLRSWRALPTGQNNLTRTTQHSLQLDCQAGVGLEGVDYEYLNGLFLITESGDRLITESNDYIIAQGAPLAPGVDPQVMLRWSDDGGHTWSNEHWKSMGRIGQTGYRTIWRRLGMTLKLRDRVYEISGTDAVKIAVMGAELHMSPTNA